MLCVKSKKGVIGDDLADHARGGIVSPKPLIGLWVGKDFELEDTCGVLPKLSRAMNYEGWIRDICENNVAALRLELEIGKGFCVAHGGPSVVTTDDLPGKQAWHA
jgi:hypothetical protein